MKDNDARAYRAVLAGKALNGELENVSGEFRPVIDKMSALPHDERKPVSDAFLAGRPDRAEILEALKASLENGRHEPAASERRAKDIEWPTEPKRVRRELRPVPPLRPEMLPSSLRGWLTDIAERISCPLDFPAVGALVSLATLVGRNVAIRPKQRDDWTVVPNLWGAAIGRPGVMKTPALTEVIKPLRRLEAEARKQQEDAVAEHNAALLMADVKAGAAKKALREAASKNHHPAILESLARAAADAAPPPPPVPKRYTTTDVTVEKLGELLRDNSAGIGIIRDELTGLIRSFEKSGRESDRSFYLEGWTGSGPAFTYDRVGRGTTVIPSPCVSIIGGMQPGPLRALLRAAARGEESDDGLISRFQLLVWPDTSGPWQNVDRWPDTDAKNRAFDIFKALDSTDPLDLGAEPGEDDRPPFLRFAPEAQDLFNAWRAVLEAKVRGPDESPIVESHLAKYRSLMPSLALLFHLADVVDGAGAEPVSLAATELAREWCDFLEAHARRAYACVSEPELESALALAERIKAGALPSPFSYRDVYRRCWSGLDSNDDVRRAVAVLEDLGWLSVVEIAETGGSPRTDVYIHPSLPRKSAPENAGCAPTGH